MAKHDKPAKSAKTPDHFKGRVPFFRVHLDYYDKENNNNKFWYIEAFAPENQEVLFYVVRRWGRNGSKGQSMVEEFGAKWEAQSYATSLVGKKKGEGYVNDPSLLEKIAREV